MSENELLCTALDNTSISQEENVGNSNPTYGVPEHFPVQNGDKSAEKDNEENTKHGVFEKEIGTASFGEVSTDKDLLKSNTSESHSSKETDEVADIVVADIIPLGTLAEHSSNSSSQHSVQKLEQDDLEADFDEDIMTGSYGEISLERDLVNGDKNSDSLNSREDVDDICIDEVKEKKRPDSLVLLHSIAPASSSQARQQVNQSQQTSESHASIDVSPSISSEDFAMHSSGRVRTGSDTSGLSELQGTLTVDGDIVTFVAEDLQEKIMMSSPVNKWAESTSFPGTKSSTPSLHRQVLQPNLHIIDPSILTDLERHSKKVATCVDTMLENLSGTLQSISSLTVDCMETYESSVCNTCDSVDANIKAVYQLMAKCEELGNAMGPLYTLSGDIKHIKKMLEQLEHIVEHKS